VNDLCPVPYSPKGVNMKFITLLIIIFLLLAAFISGQENFKLIKQWIHSNEIIGYVFYTLIDKDDHIVGTFYKTGNCLITPEKVIKIAPKGLGPGDLMDIKGLSFYHDDIVFFEQPEKAKVFTKTNGTYKIKQTIWFKRDPHLHVVKNGLFYDNKWFLAGYETMVQKKYESRAATFLKIYDHNGTPVKRLIQKSYKEMNQEYIMDYYVIGFKDRVFFMTENNFKIYIISVKDLETVKVVDLRKPEFYKEMPKDYYVWKTYDNPNDNFIKDVEKWKTTYSRIHKVIVEEEFLIIQIRTCTKNLTKFALLFYDTRNFELKRTILTEDLLLGARKGRYYFHANGDPTRDEEAENFIINIYKFVKQNEKE
jgi:hypothetical protein